MTAMGALRALLWVTAIALAAATSMGDAASAQGAEYRAGNIKILAPWTRATPESSKVGGGFMTLINAGSEPDRLIGGSTEVSEGLEIHEMQVVNGVAMMRQVNPGISLKPGASVVLKPFAHHLMLMDLKQPLRAGQTIKGTLVFERRGPSRWSRLWYRWGPTGPLQSR